MINKNFCVYVENDPNLRNDKAAHSSSNMIFLPTANGEKLESAEIDANKKSKIVGSQLCVQNL